MANRYLPKNVSATTVIPFDNPVTAIPEKTVTGPVTFTKNTTGAQVSFGAVIRVVADGTNVPDLTAFKKIGSGSYDNTSGVVNQLWFVFDGTDYCVAITHPTTIGGGGGGDTTPPTLVSGNAIDATHVTLVFSETVVPTVTGWSLYEAETSTTYSFTSVSGSGTTWTFVLASGTLTAGNTLTVNYNATTGNTVDTSSNELATLSNFSITNSVSGGGGTIDLTFTSSLSDIAATGTVWNPVPVDTTYNHHAVSNQKLASGQTGRAYFKWEYPGATENFLMMMTTQVEGNSADGKVAFATSGNSSIESIYADGVTDHSNITTETAPLYLGVYRDGSTGVMKLQKSTDATTWVDLWAYSNTYTGDLWVAIRLYGGGAIKDPKGENFA